MELKSSGIPPKENLSKHLENGIFEPRVTFETRIIRNFYFYESERQIIFTHGFVKKQQKTPKDEIVRAKAIRHSWRGEE
jgi:phage-related protein